jgi:hypothetical protein
MKNLVAESLVCGISDSQNLMHFSAFVSTGVCPGSSADRNPPNPPMHTSEGGNAANAGASPAPLTLAMVKKDLSTFLDKEMTITGQIKNLGTNLQLRTGRHIVFQDEQGSVIDATLPLATESIQSEQGEQTSNTAPMILDQPAIVRGRLEKKEDGSLVLRIENVNVKPSQ